MVLNEAYISKVCLNCFESMKPHPGGRLAPTRWKIRDARNVNFGTNFGTKGCHEACWEVCREVFPWKIQWKLPWKLCEIFTSGIPDVFTAFQQCNFFIQFSFQFSYQNSFQFSCQISFQNSCSLHLTENRPGNKKCRSSETAKFIARRRHGGLCCTDWAVGFQQLLETSRKGSPE